MKQPEQENQGLYTPQLERDSCGVGLLADLNNKPNYYILDASLTMLERMEHRGACGCEPNTGDGAGILTQIPHRFFYNLFLTEDKTLPAKGNYGVGMFFFPKNKAHKEICLNSIEKHAKNHDFKTILRRKVPTQNDSLGKSALNSEPEIEQFFFKSIGFNKKDFERRFYLLRCSILKEIYFNYPDLRDDFYIASLSSKTIVYKGLLTASQLRKYYLDLQNTNFETAVAIFHSRFSTNTIPKWKLAQPFRCIAHNGEINTIQGNINWWNAREKYMEKIAQDQPEFSKVFPVCDPFISDSGNFDNVVDFLLRASRSMPHSMMMMIPEAWQNDPQMPHYKKAFYEYHDAIIEPWEGPASICFTDGTIIGATLDRNGLRPSRYLVTSDNLLILGSETGCLDIDPTTIIKKGRLEPGKMLLADLDSGGIIADEKLKKIICQRKPYQKWLQENALNLNSLPNVKVPEKQKLPLYTKQQLHGMTAEDEKLINAMFSEGQEAIGSMGTDIPLAVLSKQTQHLGNYFKQQFAQVTNPPIDSIREKFYMSLSTALGAGSKIINIGAQQAKVLRCQSPFLTHQKLQNILNIEDKAFKSLTIDAVYTKNQSLQKIIQEKCLEIEQAIQKNDLKIICISDKIADKDHIPIPTLLLSGAIHHHLIEKGVRKEVSLIAHAADVWETHHAALLFSFGTDLICPYLALQTAEALNQNAAQKIENPSKNYLYGLEKGLLKIMSKLGISTLGSYKGAQTFEALGISQEVVNVCFKGTISRIGGMRFEDLQKENEQKHAKAFAGNTNEYLENNGTFQWRKNAEFHLFNPQTIHLLQHSTKTNNFEIYKQFALEIDKLETNSSMLRSYLRFKTTGLQPIPIEEVEPAEAIMKRFATGAMSFGSISHQAHTTLAIAMNRIGGKSNSGEGGEDAARYEQKHNGDSERSAIKQVASARFGVNIHYLTNATELQIKIAQGAKPGEGGQLPGHKVDNNIARVRNATPGVGLISPPPHHDIYSIEDLAQLIFDLKNANRQARISVKLVAKTGVGVIASGVAKAHADHILISGYDGGTGASPLSSILHAGLPWELGLSETHQTLVRNGLRDRVALQTDGQIRTGRDLAVACMLGAEEWGIATAALVVEGCILMRKCHLNTCPVGIATQDEALTAKFNGKVEHLINYFQFLAQHLREIMASMGIKTVNELVGRTDLLQIEGLHNHWKSQNLHLEALLKKEFHPNNKTLYCSTQQDHALDKVLDRTLIRLSRNALRNGEIFNSTIKINTTNRAVGAMLSNEISIKYGLKALPPETLNFNFKGSAGQSFGAFAAQGVHFNVEGEANDYFGKGLSGGILSIRPFEQIEFTPSQNTIIGNVALYGATQGEAYIYGKAGDRFAVRNSGAKAVVEGLGDNGCEYMTGGRIIVLGDIGRNFAAGMSGGIAYLYHHQPQNNYLINQEMVLIEQATHSDLDEIYTILQQHRKFTGSHFARQITHQWEKEKENFVKIMPIEYKRILEQNKVKAERSSSETTTPGTGQY